MHRPHAANTHHPTRIDVARALRRNPTPAERALWLAIRDRWNIRWRRQHTLLGYIVDFYAPCLRMVVEVDGSIHAEQREEDAHRDAALAAYGRVIVRVSNEAVLHDLATVLQQLDHLVEPLLPSGRQARRASLGHVRLGDTHR